MQIQLTVRSKNGKAVTAYTQAFESTLMFDIVANTSTAGSPALAGATQFTLSTGEYNTDWYTVTEDITSIATYGDGAIKKAEVAISSANIKLLNSVPIDIVAAPGAGKALIPVSGYTFMDFDTAAYDTSLDVSIVNEDADTVKLFTSLDILAATADEYQLLRADPSSVAGIITADSALQVTSLTGVPATGAGVLTVVLYYQEVTL